MTRTRRHMPSCLCRRRGDSAKPRTFVCSDWLRRLPGTFLVLATKAAILYHQGEGVAALRMVSAFLKQHPQHFQAQGFASELARLLGKEAP
ncbi:MAG: hypothetical protein U0176_12515 [Bacteroidia bacterium]